jgi:N6-L-threonylcarbamoyladenine synthase
MSNILILAIETSCDETAISIVRAGANNLLEVLSNKVSSQVKLHAKWGGVVPNLAAREHVKNITPIFELSLKNAGVTMENIDVIAVTSGPGLIPALMVGANFAKTLAYLWNKPLIGIHHIEGHIYANFVRANPKSQIPNPKQIQSTKNHKLKTKNYPNFPILCLVVSGGHTQLVFMQDHLQYEIVGQTLDDAAGEAFDKVARILNIGYPGGPNVALWASKFQDTKNNNQTISNNQNVKQNSKNNEAKKLTSDKLVFPRPMLNKNNFNFSFSGLKTAVLYETKKHLARNASLASASSPARNASHNEAGGRSDAGGSDTSFDKKYIAAICHEFQQASVDVLVTKTLRAAKQYEPRTIMLAGGVSANKELRKQLDEAINKDMSHVSYSVPELNLTGDNAAMIAAAAAIRWQKMSATQKKKAEDGWQTLQPDANLKLK